MTVRYTNLPDLKNKPYGGAYSVHDHDLCTSRDQAIADYVKKAREQSHEKIKKDFLSIYKEWMFSTHRGIIGWQEYSEMCFTQGTTESFAQFYIRYRESKRLRLAKGEYFYNQMMKGLWFKDKFAWLDEDDIRPGDVVLISVPFSDTGDVPDYLDDMLTDCDKKHVPVMLDLAYINLAIDREIDLSHKCIEYVVSSLSKVFPVELHRIGIRLQRKKFEDQLYVINEKNYNYINILSAYVGNELIDKFPADYIFNRYYSKQISMCAELNLEPSPCVYFGIDKQQRYKQYNRGTDSNRLCFSRVWDGRMTYNRSIFSDRKKTLTNNSV